MENNTYARCKAGTLRVDKKLAAFVGVCNKLANHTPPARKKKQEQTDPKVAISQLRTDRSQSTMKVPGEEQHESGRKRANKQQKES